MTHSNVKLVSDKIEKPDLDDRSYRIVQLENKLTALLIHDPTTHKSAASLDVNVGSFGDAKLGIPGLAHFCEHLLFMGTEKYPKENEYASYLSKNDGHSNAYTAGEHTNYYFEVNHNSLEGALDRFSQFFISPLFSKDCKDREIKAVDSENKKNLQSDVWRISQLDKATSNPKHPYNGFSTGNFTTLNDEPVERGLDVRDELLKFYGSSYSANIMKLVVLGHEDLDTLEKWTMEKFSDVPNSDLPVPFYEHQPYTENELSKIIKVKPIMDTRTLEMNFAIPDQQINWECKPAAYFSHTLGHEGPGSLLFYLKQKGWVNELHAGHMKVSNGSALFSLEHELTPEGLKNYEEVIINTFQYIKLVVESKPQKWIWDEREEMSKIDFRFKQKSGAANTVSRLSASLQKLYLPEEFILSSSILRKWVPEQVEELGNCLTADNLRIILSGRELDGLDQTEKWYGTEYSLKDIDRTFIEKLKNVELNPKFYLPIPNEFIPTDFEVRKTKTSKPSVSPYLIEDSDASRVWYKKDDQFWVPKANVDIFFHLPVTNKTPTNSVLTSLFTSLLEDELNEIVYYAEIVGLNFQISSFRDGFTIKVNGYNDKLPVLLERVLEKLISFRPKTDRFDIFKLKLIQNFENFGYSVPYGQIGTQVLTILNHDTYSHEQRLQSLKSVNIEMLENFLPLMWQDHYKEILIHGNLEKSKANEINSLISEKTKHIRVLGDKYNTLPRSYVLPTGKTFRYETLLDDPKNINSCIEYFIQISDNYKDKHTLMLAELLSKMISEPCFNQLRTKEQLGYVVFSGLRVTRTTFGLRVLIQSERSTDYLEYRIKEFLDKFGKFINVEMSDDAFEKYKESLISKKEQPFKNLTEEFNKFWNTVTGGYYHFDSRETNIEVIKSLTKAQLIQFYNDYILNTDNTGRLVVHMKPHDTPTQPTEKLVQCSVSNYLSKLDLNLSNEELDGIVKKYSNYTNEELSSLVTEITAGLEKLEEDGKKQAIPPTFKDELLELVKTQSVIPVPEGFPSGVLITDIGKFKSMTPLSVAPSPMCDLKKFLYKSDEEAKL